MSQIHGLAASSKPPPVTAAPATAVPGRRRLLSSGLAVLLLPSDAIGNEARLWQQEADLYRRRAGEALQGALATVLRPAAPPPAGAGAGARVDAEFASALLAALRAAAGPDALAYDARCSALREQELPHFQEAGRCGHCGSKTGPGALADRQYFDFEAYIRSKALLEVKRPASGALAAFPAWSDALRLTVGREVLAHVLTEVDVGEAEAGAISPIRATSSDALLSASPELDSIRRGVKALLRYCSKKGLITRGGITQFGLSSDEYENHMVWARGEPAFLRYWLTGPADQAACAALEQEEGASIGFVAAAMAAYLARCGVQATDLQRFPSLSDPAQVAEQWTLRRAKALAKGGRLWEQGYAEWKPDACPDGSADCY